MEKLTSLIPELSQQSSQKAWNEFVRFTGDDLHKYICYYLNDQEHAADILQDVYIAFLNDRAIFCKICKNEPEEIAHKKVFAWLYQTARNKCFNLIKNKKYANKAKLFLSNKAKNTELDNQPNPLEKKEANDLIRYEMSQLNERQQDLLTMKFYNEKSNAEIAIEINCEAISVPKLMERALLQLKKRLEKSGIHLSVALIGESLTIKDMCSNMPPNLIPIAVQLYQTALTSGLITNTLFLKGIIIKALYTIVGVTAMATLFFYVNRNTKETPIIVPLAITDKSPVNKLLISPEAEKIIIKALESLAKSQNEDGSWKDGYDKNVGVNSLILLAYMSMGNFPGEGKYGEVVAKGVDWVISQSKRSGLIQNLEDGGGNAMYGHGLSSLMLSEIWGHTNDEIVEEKLNKAIELIIKVQGPKGSWGYYSVAQDGDTSVSAMQMMALKSAQIAGIIIPEETILKNLAIFKKRFDTKNGMFGYGGPYNNIDSENVGTHAAATCVMQIYGEKDPVYTMQAMKKSFEAFEKHKKFDAYFLYYGSISAYQAGPESYQKWCEIMIPIIAEKQKENGEIIDVLSTAWSVISLSLPLKFIKVYQPEKK